ncbi:HlyC/CorC family transporter [Reyranella sp. MMS21-HV4-11]|jgi:Mg2+/Co2+ transporter CorB|uniref:HlyC/CorC family transporter n=1 Tax=Reyranella humidisoli TaxID=2849149 RepID=A0ABS6IJY5_9HYPH|nr:HlyC/CorC family transporter [Reyranella sp. MMS21-HV4-11]MBU8874310.1 HlyC/CorC family transporter [Reyranella sp. MMS21-HV4-11]
MDAELHFDIPLSIAVPLVFVCLLLAAYLSAAETAITGASRPRMHRLAQQGHPRAVIVNALLDRKDEAVSAVLLGNNVVNIFSASLSTAVLTALFGAAGVVYATLAIGVLIVIFAEVMPKTWALLRADRVALALAPSIMVTLTILGPLARGVAWISRFFLKLMNVRTDRTPDAEEQSDALRGAIELHGEGQTGDSAPAEKAMLRSVLDLGDRTVGDVMTHRGNVVLIDADQPTDSIVTQMLAAPYTRIPLYRGEADNVVGVVHAKDLFRAVKAAGDPAAVKIDAIMTAPWFIPESTVLFDQLEAFRARHEHFAIVVDEYGALRGIVTLEDIIEEIVGDIEDEHDAIRRGVARRDDGSMVCQGDVPIRDLNREFGWGLPEGVATTIAGLVLHEARRIPEVGQVYAFYGFRFEILKREGTRIAELRIVPPAAIQAGN